MKTVNRIQHYIIKLVIVKICNITVVDVNKMRKINIEPISSL